MSQTSAVLTVPDDDRSILLAERVRLALEPTLECSRQQVMPFGLECQELHVLDQHSGQILTLDQVGEGVVTFTPVMASGPGPFNQTWDAKASTGFLWWKDLDFSWD